MTSKLCNSCAATNSLNARFCNQCGQAFEHASPAPLDAKRAHYTPRHLVERVLKHRSAMQGERKQVTVLFADMAGSTRLAEQVDPELWHQILDEFFAILSEEIHRFEGTVNQYTGDGIMALFGAPLALEDHAQRAAFAAIALRQRLRDFADRLRLQKGLNLATRMGMNSGEVIVGSIGDDLRMDYTAKGLTVNLAARMEQIAEPGRVYLTRYTEELIRDYFQLRPLGLMSVKGASEPLEVFELEAQSDISLRLEASRRRGLSGFCGRDAEMKLLNEAQQQSNHKARICLVIGDAGLGKSRLCYEAGQSWRQQGRSVLAASGVPHGQAMPLQPVKALILQQFEVSAEESPASARRKLAGGILMRAPDLKSQLPLLFEFLGLAEGDQSTEMPADARAHRMRDVFQRICQLEPEQDRIIQIDDLHWLDAGSLEFLKIALEHAGPSTFFLLNMRPLALPPWLQEMRPQMLQLAPLDDKAMLQIANGLLGHAESMPALAQRLALHAAGNPFFIEETIRGLAAAGDLSGQPGHYQLQREPERIEIAATVQATVAGRVDRLSSGGKSLLQQAAVLGQSLDLKLLAALSQLSDSELQQQLSELEAGHYLRAEAESPGRWQFCHPILREVVYGSLLNQQREDLHRRAAEILQRYVAELALPCIEPLLMLSQHWAAISQNLLAAKAAQQAALQLQHDNASECVRVMLQILDWLDPVPDDAEAQQLVFQACVQVLRSATFLATDMRQLDACYEKARAIAEDLNDQLLLAEVMISNGARWLNRASADEAVANTGEAMRLAQRFARDGGDESLEQRFRIPILFSYFAAGRIIEGLAVLDRRDGGAWHQGEMDEDNMLSRGFRALMLAALGRLQEAELENLKAIDCVEAHQRQVSWLHANLVDIQIQRGSFDPQSELAQRAVLEAREFGSPLFEEIAIRALAQTLLARGDITDAIEVMQRSLPLVATDAVAAQFKAAHAATFSRALRLAGQAEDALRVARQGAEAGRAMAQRIWLLRCLLEQARAQLACGQVIDAVVAESIALIERTGARLYSAEVYELQAEQAAAQGDSAGYQAKMLAAAKHLRECGAPAQAARISASLVA